MGIGRHFLGLLMIGGAFISEFSANEIGGPARIDHHTKGEGCGGWHRPIACSPILDCSDADAEQVRCSLAGGG